MKKIFFTLLTLVIMFTLCGCSHEHEYEEKVVAPTCTEQGYTEYVCECGDTKKEAYVDALGHSFGAWVITKEPTADEDGTQERVCSVCSYKEVEIAVHVHKYTETVVEATCIRNGYTEYKCECGESYKDNETVGEHKEVVVAGKAATCTEDGQTDAIKCSVCSKLLKAHETIEAAGHTYGEWVIVKENTQTEEGLKEQECTSCGEKVTKVIPVADDPNATEFAIEYELDGGRFEGGYQSFDELTDAFYASWNIAAGEEASREDFCTSTVDTIKIALRKADFLAEWNWLFTYMLEHLKEFNNGTSNENSSYVTYAYDVLEGIIAGDTKAIIHGEKGPNARTLIRSYLNGMLNKKQGGNNATFRTLAPDFSLIENQQKVLAHQHSLKVTLPKGETLPIPVKDGYTFLGWMDRFDNMVTTASTSGVLTALWSEDTPVEAIAISNKVEEIDIYSTYQLTWAFTPEDAGDRRVVFSSSDDSIATVDENGLITTHRAGTVTITITSLSGKGFTDEMTVKVVTPGYFDISYETVSYVLVGESIKLNAKYINNKNEEVAVEWSSLDTSAATVDKDGYVTGLKVGTAKIRATVKGSTDVYQDFVVTVIDAELNEALNLVLNAHESNIFIRYDLPIGSGTPNYYSDILGSVSKLLYNQELVIDTTYNEATNAKYGDSLEDRIMDSIEFITVHYTAGFNETAGGAAHGAYFAKSLSEVSTSIHYSTGNDGVYKGLDEKYAAAHAGDGGATDPDYHFEWIDTPVDVLESDPEFPVTSITSKGTFAINGRDTGIKVPEETKFGRGFVTDSKWLNDQGIAVNVKDGKYQVGTTWWCYTQVAEGRICSKGGNGNSIGIESAVNKGSDLWYTWQITAQLVADIMVRYNLDLTKVKGHHFYAAKDCPQPMLENDLEIWWEFIELVRSEHEKITTCKDYEFTFECDSELVNDKGRVVGQSAASQVVTYKVTVTKDGQTQTIELASIIEGTYNK